MAYFISAYATSPSFNYWNPSLESVYFQALASSPDIVGIEHPYLLDSEKYPLPWMLKNIPDHWSISLTALPLFMNEIKKNPYLGLASVNKDAREQAVSLMKQISQYAEVLNNQFGRKIVKAIHFHSLPRNDNRTKRGSKEALMQSLDEMRSIDWQNAELNLEHCDAHISNQLPDKGLLLLDEEIAALTSADGYGIVLNWARSAIEGRSASVPLQHIIKAKKAGLLRGFFFSGCTNKADSDYGAWKDTHMPPKNFIGGRYLRNDSLLGDLEIENVIKELATNATPVYCGIKVLDISDSNDMATKIGLNLETLAAINQVEGRLNTSN